MFASTGSEWEILEMDIQWQHFVLVGNKSVWLHVWGRVSELVAILLEHVGTDIP